MFRSVLRVAPRSFKVARVGSSMPIAKAAFATPFRFYSASSLSREEITKRVIDVVRSFDKTAAASDISANTTFAKDLNLDSLDTVELLVAVEEEFDIEIPDKIADELTSVGQTIEYIASNPEVS
ncbi:HCL250Cp [Eremothecium sinecaudum]|uniref:Acyl carrier protein n=1 Tax=Eremothecium sinecaudum TaxID=45286 RepID=A0A0X8HQ43_9SACH|nr:HCL250Cp [Eremothecium sinecaudum]AMD19901.1 HCL250Cp [Eremothecium sinecaudum]